MLCHRRFAPGDTPLLFDGCRPPLKKLAGRWRPEPLPLGQPNNTPQPHLPRLSKRQRPPFVLPGEKKGEGRQDRKRQDPPRETAPVPTRLQAYRVVHGACSEQAVPRQALHDAVCVRCLRQQHLAALGLPHQPRHQLRLRDGKSRGREGMRLGQHTGSPLPPPRNLQRKPSQSQQVARHPFPSGSTTCALPTALAPPPLAT